MFDVKVPEFGESIQEVQVFQWLKKPGEWVEMDDDLVELESEKASQALAAPTSGILSTVATTKPLEVRHLTVVPPAPPLQREAEIRPPLLLMLLRLRVDPIGLCRPLK